MTCPRCDSQCNEAGNLNNHPTYWCVKCGCVWLYVGEGLWGPVYVQLETPRVPARKGALR